MPKDHEALTVAGRVLSVFQEAGRTLTHAEVGQQLGISQPEAHRGLTTLLRQGWLTRDETIRPMRYALADHPPTRRLPGQDLPGLLGEDAVKEAIAGHLESIGYEVASHLGAEHGIDVEGRRGPDRIVLEAKGDAVSEQTRRGYWLNALAELLTVMDDPAARYGLALPDVPTYRRHANRLPAMVWNQLHLTIYWVRPDGTVFEQGSPVLVSRR